MNTQEKQTHQYLLRIDMDSDMNVVIFFEEPIYCKNTPYNNHTPYNNQG